MPDRTLCCVALKVPRAVRRLPTRTRCGVSVAPTSPEACVRELESTLNGLVSSCSRRSWSGKGGAVARALRAPVPCVTRNADPLADRVQQFCEDPRTRRRSGLASAAGRPNPPASTSLNFLERTDWRATDTQSVIDASGQLTRSPRSSRYGRVCGSVTIPTGPNAATSIGCDVYSHMPQNSRH